MPSASWYKKAKQTEDILQGDLVRFVPIFIPKEVKPDTNEGTFIRAEEDVVVLTQSCDIGYDKVEDIVVCLFRPISKFKKFTLHDKKGKEKEDLRRGNRPSLHLLNQIKYKGFESGYHIVFFNRIYTVRLDFLKETLIEGAPRLHMLSPYREHLAQAFARFFMRVGLPKDIPSFVKKRKKSQSTKKVKK